MLNQLKTWVDHPENHEVYLDSFFRRQEPVVTEFRLPPERLEPRILALIDESFEPFASALDDALKEIHRVFKDAELRKEIQDQVRRNLKDTLTDDADDCVAFIFETLIRRAGSYNALIASVKVWTRESVRHLVIEWLQSKKGRGGNRERETPEADWIGASEGDQVESVIDRAPSSILTPGEALEKKSDCHMFYNFLQEHLTSEQWKLLELSDIDELPSLTVARMLGFEPKTDRLLEEAAKAMCARANGKAPPKFIQPLVEAAQAAGIAMNPGSDPLLMAAQIDEAARRLDAVGDVLETLKNNQIADRVRQRLKNLHRRVRRLIAKCPEIGLVCDSIQERADNRGEVGVHKFHAGGPDASDSCSGDGLEGEDGPDENREASV